MNPIYIGYGPKVTPESPPQAFFTWGVTVEATGTLRGTIQRVDARLKDRTTGLALGNAARPGPFLNIRDPRIANQVVDPLLETGRQTFTAYQQDLGFMGSPATLEIEVAIKDSTGTDWTAATTALCELFPKPVVRSPVDIMVRQNDPRSGCPLDPVHGYGLLLDIVWDYPAGNPRVDDYTVAVSDGSGKEIIWPYYAHTPQTSWRLVRCDMHVPVGADHGARVGVSATSQASGQSSGFAVGRFDFQSCREAGTPACQ
jgi:hypothetical protein